MLNARSHYQTLLSLNADLIWENSIRHRNEKRLLKLIDQALDARDADAFHQYSAELKQIRKDDEHEKPNTGGIGETASAD